MIGKSETTSGDSGIRRMLLAMPQTKQKQQLAPYDDERDTGDVPVKPRGPKVAALQYGVLERPCCA